MFDKSNDPRLRDLDQATAAFALLSAHEFMVEVLLANFLATLSTEAAQGMVDELSDRWQRAYTLSVVNDPAHADRHLQACQAFTESLLRKAQRRAFDLREHRSAPIGRPA